MWFLKIYDWIVEIQWSVRAIVADMRLDTFITMRASGAPWQPTHAWAGAAGLHCNDWTATSGGGRTANPGSTRLSDLRGIGFTVQCANSFPVICLQESANAAARARRPLPGR